MKLLAGTKRRKTARIFECPGCQPVEKARAASASWLRYQNFFFFMIHRQISTTSTLTAMTAG